MKPNPNEEESITKLMSQIKELLQKFDYKIVLINRGSTLNPVINVNLVSTLILLGFNFFATGINGSIVSVNK